MRAELRDSLQELWEASLHERALLVQRSAAPVLDGILAAPAAVHDQDPLPSRSQNRALKS